MDTSQIFKDQRKALDKIEDDFIRGKIKMYDGLIVTLKISIPNALPTNQAFIKGQIEAYENVIKHLQIELKGS